jgi:hypothetical protein
MPTRYARILNTQFGNRLAPFPLKAPAFDTPTPKAIRPMRGSGSNYSRACGILDLLYVKRDDASPG